MKKTMTLTTMLLMTSITIAQQIHVEEAITVSQNVMKSTRNDSPQPETEYVAVRRNAMGDTVMYEVMMDNGLSVFVSGNRRTKPILGVCENYGTSILYNLDDIPDGLKCMLDNYYDQIEYAFGSDSMMMGVNSEWSEAVKGNLPSVDTIVNSILTTKWGQTQSNDGNHLIAYNYYMPQGACTTGSNCPAGCVAVAMAQVMNHWKTPTFFLTIWNLIGVMWLMHYSLPLMITKPNGMRYHICYIIVDCR